MTNESDPRSKPGSKHVINPFTPSNIEKIVSPFTPSKIQKIESEVRNYDSKERLNQQSDPPLVVQPPAVKHGHPISLIQKIALSVATFAAITSRGIEIPVGPLTDPGTSLDLKAAQEASSAREARQAELLREVAQAVFEHFVDESIDEAFEAIAERYAEILRHKGEFSTEEQQEFDRFPSPTDPHDGRSIFECAWMWMRPVVCADQDSRSASSDETFAWASTITLKAANIVSPPLAMWAGLIGACLSIVRKSGVEAWCDGT